MMVDHRSPCPAANLCSHQKLATVFLRSFGIHVGLFVREGSRRSQQTCRRSARERQWLTKASFALLAYGCSIE